VAAIGPETKAAIPVLTELLDDKDVSVWCAAAEALGKLGPEARTAVSALTRLLKNDKALSNDDWQVRQFAIEALGSIGPQAEAAIPALTRLLLRDSNPEVWRLASDAWNRIKGNKG
jgi:HEAT repeat protein